MDCSSSPAEVAACRMLLSPISDQSLVSVKDMLRVPSAAAAVAACAQATSSSLPKTTRCTLLACSHLWWQSGTDHAALHAGYSLLKNMQWNITQSQN